MATFNGLSEAEASFLTYIDDYHSLNDLKVLFGNEVTQERIYCLSSHGYIGTNPNTNNPTLLPSGHTALNEYLSYKAIEKKNRKTERFRFWFPLIISNCFALASLVISIIALMK